MRLIGNVKIHWQGEKLADERLLEELRQRWHKKTVLPTMLSNIDECDKSRLLLRLFHELVPFVIISKEDEGELVLEAFLEIFPFINGKGASQAFSLRLVPTTGSVEEINHDLYYSTAINTHVSTHEKLVSDTGNGAVRFECYFKKPTGELPGMVPPEGHEKEVNESDLLD